MPTDLRCDFVHNVATHAFTSSQLAQLAATKIPWYYTALESLTHICHFYGANSGALPD